MALITDILTGGSNSHPTTSEAANSLATDFIPAGVVGAITATSGVAPMTGAYAVNAQGSPDMTVAVTTGVAYAAMTPTSQGSQTVRTKLTANQNVTISANATGGTRYDWVYVSLSAANAANTNVAGDNVATLVTSRSTSATTDTGTPPTYGYNIAKVTVANGASSITNGNIADTRTQTTATQLPGTVVQVVETAYTAVDSTSTQIPTDDTIPQNTEGKQFMTQTITPKAATNKLSIEAVLTLSSDTATRHYTGSLFQDSTANALAAAGYFQTTAGVFGQVIVRHPMVAGTTSATTFNVRAGISGTGTLTFNGIAAARIYGGITVSSIKITEYKV